MISFYKKVLDILFWCKLIWDFEYCWFTGWTCLFWCRLIWVFSL